MCEALNEHCKVIIKAKIKTSKVYGLSVLSKVLFDVPVSDVALGVVRSAPQERISSQSLLDACQMQPSN